MTNMTEYEREMLSIQTEMLTNQRAGLAESLMLLRNINDRLELVAEALYVTFEVESGEEEETTPALYALIERIEEGQDAEAARYTVPPITYIESQGTIEDDIYDKKKTMENQATIIALLKKLIVVTGASAIATPDSAINIYSRQDAAYYAKQVFENGKKTGNGSYDEPLI